MHIGIATNPTKQGAEAIGLRLASWCASKGLKYSVYHDAPEMDLDTAHVDILVAVGGDGSLLRFAAPAATRGIPMLGVNLGRVGFLSEVHENELEDAMQRVLAGDYLLDRRMMLSCTINGRDPFLCLNDIMVSKSSFSGVAEIRISVNDSFVGDVFCDGVIVATPTGSTGYSLSAGGSVLAPGLDALAVTPICPHTLHIRPIVTSKQAMVTLSMQGSGIVSGDGRLISSIGKGDTVLVTGSDMTCDFIRFTTKDLFALIRDKLA